MAIDDSVHHNLSLWDWQKGDKGSKITETKVNIRQREESIPEPLILLGESSERSIKRPPPRQEILMQEGSGGKEILAA